MGAQGSSLAMVDPWEVTSEQETQITARKESCEHKEPGQREEANAKTLRQARPGEQKAGQCG